MTSTSSFLATTALAKPRFYEFENRPAPPPMNTTFILHVSNAHVLMSIAYLTLNISFAPATYAPNDFTFTTF